MILHSELSRRRIRSIKKLIRVNKLEVVSVLRVDKDKGKKEEDDDDPPPSPSLLYMATGDDDNDNSPPIYMLPHQDTSIYQNVVSPQMM